MTRKLTALLSLMVLCSTATAQSITVPDVVKIPEPGLVVIRATAVDADDAKWYPVGSALQKFPDDLVPPKLGVFMGFTLKAGTHKVEVIPAKAVEGKAVIGEKKIVTVIVGVDPGPGPDPDPDPLPPAKGLRVLFVYESSAALSVGQTAVLNSTLIDDYMNAKCVKDGWRKWDKDVDTKGEGDVWKAIWTATKPTLPALPALVIITDQRGQAFPLPATVEDCLALLKKYGG